MSPHFLVRGRNSDFKIHCRVPFRPYYEVYDEPNLSNTSESRTIGAIVLGPNGNLQGGYSFMSFKIGKKLNRRSWTELPLTENVIRSVERMSEK